MSNYQIGPAALTMQDADLVFGIFPKSRYAPGAELLTDHDGGLVPVGYPRSFWILDSVDIATYQTAIVTTLSISGYSGEVYIQTRDEYDAWSTYRALMRLPDPSTLDRWSGDYNGVEIEFVLLEVIP